MSLPGTNATCGIEARWPGQPLGVRRMALAPRWGFAMRLAATQGLTPLAIDDRPVGAATGAPLGLRPAPRWGFAMCLAATRG
jgi:hypothetical protein